jgi:hypothetical protein
MSTKIKLLIASITVHTKNFSSQTHLLATTGARRQFIKKRIESIDELQHFPP